MRFHALIFSALFACINLSAQVNKADSAWLVIDREHTSAKKLELLNTLSFQLFTDDLERANVSTQQALKIAEGINSAEAKGWTLAYRGVYYFLSGSLEEAKVAFDQSLSIAQRASLVDLQLYVLVQLGNTSRDQAFYNEALEFYEKAKKIGSSQNKSYYYSVLKMNLSRYYLLRGSASEALKEASEALSIRQSLKDSIRTGDALILISKCYHALDNLEESENYLEKVKSLLKKDKQLKSDYLLGMGEIYFRRGDFDKALSHWSEVLQEYRQSHYKHALATLLLRIGTAFEEQGYYDLALEYLADALTVSDRSNYRAIIAEIYHQQAWIYFRNKNFEESLSTSEKAESIFKDLKAQVDVARCWDLQGLSERNKHNYERALSLHQKSLDIRKKYGNRVELSAGLFNVGEFYIFTNNHAKALPYYHQSLSIDKSIGDKYGVSLNYNRLGDIYTNLSVFDSAEFYLNQSFKLATPSSSNEVYRENFLDMAAFYEKKGKPEKAISFYKKFNILRDSISGQQTAQTLSAYRILYDVQKNEQQLQLLQKDNELSKAALRQQRLILYTLVTGLLLFFVLAGMYYRFNRKLRKLNYSLAERNEEIQAQAEELTESNNMLHNLNREIAEQKEEIQAQAEELTESNQTITQINNMLEERVELRTAELKQAFKELDTFFYRSSHDFRRPLTTFMGLAEVARVLVKDPLALELFERVNENAQNLDKMLRKFQSISDVGTHENIYKLVILKDIIEIELKKLTEELRKKNIKASYKILCDKPLYSYASLLSIVIHNLIENAIAFSKVGDAQISIQVYEAAHELVLQVYDNGMGIEEEYQSKVFDMYFRGSESSKGNGLGLYIVKKTVDKLKGRIELTSTAGKETTIRIFLPFQLTE